MNEITINLADCTSETDVLLKFADVLCLGGPNGNIPVVGINSGRGFSRVLKLMARTYFGGLTECVDFALFAQRRKDRNGLRFENDSRITLYLSAFARNFWDGFVTTKS